MSIDRYLDLVPSQNKDKQKFIAWLSVTVTELDAAYQLQKTMYQEFKIATATGDQLDIIGEIVGVERTVNFQPSGAVSPIMDDATYRIMVNAKIAKNQWDGTNENIVTLWNQLFPTTTMILLDNQDMTVTVVFIGLSSVLQQELVTNGYIIPKASGVKYNYTFTDNVIFGFDLDNAFYSGFDTGYWI